MCSAHVYINTKICKTGTSLAISYTTTHDNTLQQNATR